MAYAKLDSSFYNQVLVEVCKFLIFFLCFCFAVLSMFVFIMYFCHIYREKQISFPYHIQWITQL